MNQEERITSILFSDLKGYSNIRDDNLKAQLVKLIEDEVTNHILNPNNHFYYNTWGDAFLVCSNNPLDTAEIALKMRDTVKTKNWKKFGFQEDIAIRIGLHIQTVKLFKEKDGSIKNVVGKGVDKTARIEPITEPNKVFCSDLFYQHLLNENVSNIKCVDIGQRLLAKNFGEMNLYQLVWSHENLEHNKPSFVQDEVSEIPMPKIRKNFTDKQKSDFLNETFEEIKSYFNKALENLEAAETEIETALQEINNAKFICEIYIQGQLKSKCKIWIDDNSYSGNQINYSEGNFQLNDNSYNDCISVLDDGFEIYLSVLGSGFSMLNQPEGKVNQKETSEYLWRRFTKNLEY